ncbi:hypothetical protein H072_4522 [Dactylellina haptotyla CBS 200.50]|uniref:Uncharacterized protein n=1 Tax=Dactylellina haptotyla (strain CBS 200.50) TaxID=1284197 RepID=S8BQ45_DACHA|nr:hypothetical protein H072_4522 [Dactylellina haptotyla CBS 200.50]
MVVRNFGPFLLDDSFVYTFFPLLAIVGVVLYVKSKEASKLAKERVAAAPYSLWEPNRRPKPNDIKNMLSSFLQEPVTPTTNIDILSSPPVPFRPYKPIYHMTMGIEKCVPNDLFLLDSSYPDRIALRKQLTSQYSTITLGASPLATDAIQELYTYLISHHMPSRFPHLFTVDTEKSSFTNHVSGDTHPLEPPGPSLAALKILASTVEEDILILQRDPQEEIYRLRAFIACFPNGFDSSQKMNLPLREIHEPVPMFKEKLAPSMDRFFNKLEVGKWVKRFNWTISTHNKLFLPTENHVYEGEEIPDELESVDLETTYLRVERQVLFRLPVSKAMIFFVRTYLTPLKAVKAEGQGEALATAIEGMPEKLAFYKRRGVWGKAVTVALRA